MANLTQLRMLEQLNAFLFVNKPAGIAFSTVVKTVKRKFNLVKVGHGGSLETAASGLLVLLINDANKFTGEIMGADRVYTGTFELGKATNTGDRYGKVISNSDLLPDDLAMANALKDFRGDIFQAESRYCSIRKEGACDYEVADTGEHKPFLTHVYRFDVTRLSERTFSFSVSATKSLIVRTLIDDLGKTLGCGAILTSLCREKIGNHTLKDAVDFDRVLRCDAGDFVSLTCQISTVLSK